MFMTIESAQDNSQVKMVARLRNQTAEKLWILTCCECNPLVEEEWKAAAKESILAFQKSIVEAVQEKGYEGEDFIGNRWSFSGAFLYSLTVITTIGESQRARFHIQKPSYGPVAGEWRN